MTSTLTDKHVRRYLTRFGNYIEQERGPVPLLVAAVVGTARELDGQTWLLDPAVGDALGVLLDTYPRQQIWGGCQWLQSLARQTRLATGLTGPELWIAVVQLEAPEVLPLFLELADEEALQSSDQESPPSPLDRMDAALKSLSSAVWLAGRVGITAIKWHSSRKRAAT